MRRSGSGDEDSAADFSVVWPGSVVAESEDVLYWVVMWSDADTVDSVAVDTADNTVDIVADITDIVVQSCPASWHHLF